jgi:acylphosphatase
MKARVHVFVSGRVQGVFFRAETAHIADRLGLVGWVRNLPDGRVEGIFSISDRILQCYSNVRFADHERT